MEFSLTGPAKTFKYKQGQPRLTVFTFIKCLVDLIEQRIIPIGEEKSVKYAYEHVHYVL